MSSSAFPLWTQPAQIIPEENANATVYHLISGPFGAAISEDHPGQTSAPEARLTGPAKFDSGPDNSLVPGVMVVSRKFKRPCEQRRAKIQV